MGKLHELLAVEGDLQGLFNRILGETSTTFDKKEEHFTEHTRDLKMFDESRQKENVSEHKVMMTTVDEKLRYAKGPIIRYLDAVLQKDATNQKAVADLVIDGKTLAHDVPATTLLGFETKLRGVREMFEQIPTLQPGIDWQLDTSRGSGVYAAKQADVRMRTEKTIQHKVLVDPTDHHPAQVEKWNSDVPVGTITVKNWSGMMSSADKSALLARTDNLIRGVKKARQRANGTVVVKRTIGADLFEYMLDGAAVTTSEGGEGTA